MIKSPQTLRDKLKQEYRVLFDLYQSGNISDKNLLIQLSDIHKRNNLKPDFNLQAYFKNQKQFKYRGDILQIYYNIILHKSSSVKPPKNQGEAVEIKIKDLLAKNCTTMMIVYDNRKKYKNPIIAKYIGQDQMFNFLNERT